MFANIKHVNLMSFPTNRGFKGGRVLTADEKAEYLRDLESLHEYDRALDLFPIVATNARAMAVVARQIEGLALAGIEGSENAGVRRRATQAANTAIVNFLTAMRLFLDHMETRLVRQYGKDSALSQEFKRVTHEVYENSRAYRVLYHLRNFLHCGLPLRQIYVTGKLVRGQPEHIVSVSFDVQDLLDRYQKWRHAKADLEALKPRFEVAPMVAEMMKDLKKIKDAVNSAELPGILDAAERIVTLLREAAEDTGKGAVVEITESHARRVDLKFLLPPVRALKVLGIDASVVATP